MSSLVISGDTSGSVTLQAPAVSGTTILTLPATSGTVITTASGTASSATTATTATNITGGVAGAVPYQSGSGATGFSAAGTSGQVLQSNGVSAPSWVTPAGITIGTPVASTSGTSIDFTGIPSGVKQIVVSFDGVSTNGTSRKLIQLGDSGGIETAAYTSASSWLYSGALSGANTAAGFLIKSEVSSERLRGSITITLVNSSTNTWAGSGVFADADGGDSTFTSGGSKALSGVLDRVRITTINGTDTFDAGQINIAYM